MTLPPVPQNKNNLPIYTMFLTVIMVGLGIVALVFIPARNQGELDLLITMIISSVPGLIAAGFGERNHRDIRNGVVQEKVKQGALDAFKESGVQATVDAAGRGQASELAMKALAALLEANTSIHLTHTATDTEPEVKP